MVSPNNEYNFESTRRAAKGFRGVWRDLPLEAKILLSVVAAFAALVFTFQLASCLALVASLGSNPDRQLTEWEEKSAPDLSILTLDGQVVRLSSFRGKRVVVDFWATWCPPCIREVPHFRRLTREIPREDLVVLGVSDESSAKLRQFVRENQIEYLVGHPRTPVPPYSEITSIPTTFFINREGLIESVLVGYHSYDELKALAVGEGSRKE
jgi:thiol-disulfide isomerase/thioredoxin